MATKNLNYLKISIQVVDLSGDYKDTNEHLQKDEIGFRKVVQSALENAGLFENPFERTAEGAESTRMRSFLSRTCSELYKPCSTGLSFLDEFLEGGIPSQTLTLIMAAPAIGKTALCQQIANTIAESKRKVVYFSFDMSWDQLVARSLSSRLQKHNCCIIPVNKILWHMNWSEEEMRQIEEQAIEYEREVLPYLIYNPEEVTNKLESLLAYLDRLGLNAQQRNEQAPIVFVDDIQLISTEKNWDRQELVKQTVLGLKEYAKKYNTFVVAVVATNHTSNANGSNATKSGQNDMESVGDYIISLSDTDLDQKQMPDVDSEQVAKLQGQNPRKITIRLLKSHFISAGKSKQLWFDAANSTFSAGNLEAFAEDVEAATGRINLKEVYDEKMVCRFRCV